MVRPVIAPHDVKGNYIDPLLQDVAVDQEGKSGHSQYIQCSLFPVDRIAHDVRQEQNDHACIAKSRHIADPDRNEKLQGQFAYQFRMVIAFHREQDLQASEEQKSCDRNDPVDRRHPSGPQQKLQRRAFMDIAPQGMAGNECDV